MPSAIPPSVTAKSYSVEQFAIADILNRQASVSEGGLARVVEANKLQVQPNELRTWIDDTLATRPTTNLWGPVVTESPTPTVFDEAAIRTLYALPSVQVRARDLSSSWSHPDRRTPENAPVSDLCAVTAAGRPESVAQGRAKRTNRGVGFRLTPFLVMTCRHVLPGDVRDCEEVQFAFPHHTPTEGQPGTVNASQILHAKRSAGSPRLLVESPWRGDAVENSDWNAPPAAAGPQALDFALLEIDYDRDDEWSIRVDGPRGWVGDQNLYKLIVQVFPNGSAPLRPDPLAPGPEELRGDSLELVYLDEDHLESRLPAGVSDVSAALQRIRYQADTFPGYSGSPLVRVDQGARFVNAIHHYRLGALAQAVPLRPILETIATSGLETQHKSDLQGLGWLPSNS